MDEYIEREALEVDLNHRLNFLMGENGEYDHYTSGFDEAVTRVENFPDADVAPVVHGRWDDSGRYTFPSGNTAVRCTNCGCALTESEYRLNNWNYCPVCGARMDGGDDDEKSM